MTILRWNTVEKSLGARRWEESGIKDSIYYSKLRPGEAKLLGTIDRSERIHTSYRLENGVLSLEKTPIDVAGWDPAELAEYIVRSEALIRAGGTVFAAWDGSERIPVGIGSLDVCGVGGDETLMKLDVLYVSAGYRGLGIGRKLVEMIGDLARSLGATALYISATATRGTVDSYLRMGARLRTPPDPALLALEPEDIHLTLPLG